MERLGRRRSATGGGAAPLLALLGTSLAAPARLARLAGRALTTILGAPDYERYLAHMRARHPDRQPLAPREFTRRRLEERYRSPGSRCC